MSFIGIPFFSWNKISDVDICSYDSFTSLIMHFDGSQGQTSTIDSSCNGFTVTSFTASLSATYSKFGSASLEQTRNNTWFALPVDDAFNFDETGLQANGGTGSFTIDFWVMQPTVSATAKLEVYADATNDNSRNLILLYNNTVYIQSYLSTDTSYRYDISVPITYTNGVWKHIAIVRNYTSGVAGDWFIFVDGVAGTKTLWAGSYANKSYHSTSGGVHIGSSPYTGYSTEGSWYVDELRVSKGVARWTSNFTPPTSPY